MCFLSGHADFTLERRPAHCRVIRRRVGLAPSRVQLQCAIVMSLTVPSLSKARFKRDDIQLPRGSLSSSSSLSPVSPAHCPSPFSTFSPITPPLPSLGEDVFLTPPERSPAAPLTPPMLKSSFDEMPETWTSTLGRSKSSRRTRKDRQLSVLFTNGTIRLYREAIDFEESRTSSDRCDRLTQRNKRFDADDILLFMAVQPTGRRIHRSSSSCTDSTWPRRT